MRIVFAAVVLTMMPTVGEAQDTRPEAKNVDPVVITATKVETPVSETGAAVTVIPGEDFKTYHYATVGDALRRVPGVDVRQSGSFGKTTAISIRGANPSQVQVLVDGVRVKSPTLGQAELVDIAPDLIERIEVVRGPQSTLYGADAIGGVVNIITKKGQGKVAQGSIEEQAGNYGTWINRGTGYGQWKILDYSFAGSYAESNGQFRNDAADQKALSGRVGLTLPYDSSVSFIARWNRTDTDLPVKFVCCGPLPIQPIIDVNQQQQSETLVLSLEGRTHPVPWWESRARISRYENSQGFQDPVDPGFEDSDFPSFAQINVERREAEWINSFHIGKWSTSTIGLEYRHEEGESRHTFESQTHTKSVFFEQQLRFFERLFLTGGFRAEDNSVWGTTTTERGSVAFLIKETGTRIRGGAGSGFRAPTLNDLFFPNFSNPSLKPETSFSWEVGADQTLWGERIRLGVTVFRTDFDDLIRFVPVDAFPFVAAVNIARARSSGLEFTGEVDLLKNLVASVNYTYTDTEDLSTDRWLPREPQHRWNIGVIWEPIRRLQLFTQINVGTRQFESEEVGYNRGHTRIDVGGTFRLLDKYGILQALDLTARVNNILNEGYAEVRGFPALGTAFLLGARASF